MSSSRRWPCQLYRWISCVLCVCVCGLSFDGLQTVPDRRKKPAPIASVRYVITCCARTCRSGRKVGAHVGYFSPWGPHPIARHSRSMPSYVCRALANGERKTRSMTPSSPAMARPRAAACAWPSSVRRETSLVPWQRFSALLFWLEVAIVRGLRCELQSVKRVHGHAV